ncbi:hypothetical protein Q2T42_18240 [Leptolyngbya boryana CZ1]|uniref:Uncharacterized protein n=1 Tax=Leptolyngbya boryana CZ1 TaxID=3060204 RepID=A0AA96WT36_LEPBY|nr:hypothetical protein [Leptolyngbya boryana]WNZ43784.1 hypothetical protein Q2T42_18240 [Leptolyngbya boryana CZ1]
MATRQKSQQKSGVYRIGWHCVSIVLPKRVVDEHVGCESGKRSRIRRIELLNGSVQFEFGVVSDVAESLAAMPRF